MANADELARLDVLHGLLACAHNIEYFDDRTFDGRVTKTIALIRRVSEQAARRYKNRFAETMRRERDAGNPAVRAVYLEIDEPVSPQPFFRKDRPETEANRRLFRERDRLLAEFRQDCKRDGLSPLAYEMPTEVMEQQDRDLWV